MKYLIVDDSSRFRKFVRDEITKCGDVVYELDDGLNVLELYKEVKPDWVITDIQMKIVDGFEAIKNLRAVFPHARVIILSNYSDNFYRQKATSLGIDAFISKENIKELNDILSTPVDN